MARAKVRLNGRGIEDVFSQWAAKDGEARMERVAAAARASAPVASGSYRDSIEVRTVNHNGRAVVQVVADIAYGMSVEASRGTLARALDSAGGG